MENNSKKSKKEKVLEFISKIDLPLNISRTNYIRNMLKDNVITYNDISAEILESYKFNIERDKEYDLSKLDVVIDELIWKVELNSKKTNAEMVEFEYYKDKKGKYWLSRCEVPDEYHRRGIGSYMIKQAIKKYGQVYFSNATHLEFNTRYPNNGYDSRYLTEMGVEFVKSLIKNNIIPENWLRFPEL